MSSLKNDSENQPVKQFYNRKTGKWHVYVRGTENQPLKIGKVVAEPIQGVEKCGKYTGKTETELEPGQSTSSKHEQSKTEGENDTREETGNNHKGFFNFL